MRISSENKLLTNETDLCFFSKTSGNILSDKRKQQLSAEARTYPAFKTERFQMMFIV